MHARLTFLCIILAAAHTGAAHAEQVQRWAPAFQAQYHLRADRDPDDLALEYTLQQLGHRLLPWKRSDLRVRVALLTQDEDMQGNPANWPDQVIRQRILPTWQKDPDFTTDYLLVVYVRFSEPSRHDGARGVLGLAVGPNLDKSGALSNHILSTVRADRLTSEPSADMAAMIAACLEKVDPRRGLIHFPSALELLIIGLLGILLLRRQFQALSSKFPR